MKLLVGLAIICLCDAVAIQNLGGLSWTAYNQNKSITIHSRVPGSIYSDLQGNQKIGAIYSDFNDVNTRWVSYDNWTFERHFDVDADILNKEHIYLTAHGLDTIGEVVLNGQTIIFAKNMFIRYTYPIKSILKPKQNLLQVKFQSAPLVAKQIYERIQKEKYSIPPNCVPNVQKGECHVNMLRKMQASFAWDWGPAFPTQGIWKPITIEAYNSLLLRDVTVDTQPEGNGQWELKYTVHVEMIPAESKGFLEVFLDNTLLSNSSYVIESFSNTALKHFSVKVPESLKIQPWFPNGLGEQKLYNLTIKITPEHQESQSKSLKIGFRTIKLIQEKLPSKTEAYSFYFQVNDVPFFAKGSNWIPAHALQEDVTEGYIRELLYSAKLANMNMLRIWGGGIYESDILYQIADEYGIMLWQDMMFACALYETDPSFLNSVSEEIRQQIRRLQHHPSIAVWSGNNENEAALVDGWWNGEILAKNHEHYKDDYRTLYIKTIMPIVQAEDQSRTYLPSSPSNGIMSPKDNYISKNPSSPLYGDVHFYTNNDPWSWTTYPSAKFVSEYGFQSWASLHTMQGSLEATDMQYPLDKSWLHREHSDPWFNLPNMIHQYLPIPSAGNISKLEDYIYTSQIYQAMSIKTETEFYRRNRAVKEDGTGHTMGALYWQLNDIWPTVSWASVEYGGKWKMLHYFAKNFFANQLVNAWEEDGEFRVAVVRDDHGKEEKLQLHIDVFDWSSLKPIHQQEIDVVSKPFNVTLAFHQNADQFLKSANCKDRKHCIVKVHITENGQVKSSNFYFPEFPKNAIGLEKASVAIESVHGPTVDKHGQHNFVIKLTTNHIAPFVWIDFVHSAHLDGRFSDNGFVLTDPTIELNLTTKYSLTAEALHKTLVVKSIGDVN